MTKFSNDDEPLVEFLQKHRPHIPEGKADLEAQIMAVISNSETILQLNQSNRFMQNVGRGFHWWLWFIPAAIAAVVLMTWGGQRYLSASKPNPAQLASLEAFIESNWDGSGVDTEPMDNDSDSTVPSPFQIRHLQR